MIEDEQIHRLIRASEAVTGQKLTGKPVYQIFRGVSSLQWKNDPVVTTPNCARQKLLFKEEDIIAKYCFDCFKIVIKPRTIIELLKLATLFNELVFTDDNTRKCLVDTRPSTEHTYIGLIYFQSREDIEQYFDYVTDAVAQQISPDLIPTMKRGCSEFAARFPGFDKVEQGVEAAMDYPAAWTQKEANFETNGPVSTLAPLLFDSYNLKSNKSEFSNAEHLIILFWLCCAETFGDNSYHRFTDIKYYKIKQLIKPVTVRPEWH